MRGKRGVLDFNVPVCVCYFGVVYWFRLNVIVILKSLEVMDLQKYEKVLFSLYDSWDQVLVN